MANWMVPLVALSSGAIILMTALITMLSASHERSAIVAAASGQVDSIQQESGPAATARGISSWSKRLLLPHYTSCIQTPHFKAGSLDGDCPVLHQPTTSYFKPPTSEFRKVDTVTVDPSQCQVYVDDIRPASYSKATMKPFEVKVRPHSTDHDVFLQVYCGGDFEFMKTLATFIPMDRPVTFLDAGANIGLASVLFSQMIMSNGEVIAVDANPDTLEVARMNVAQFGNVVQPVQAAVVDASTGREKSSLTFTGETNQYWGFRVDHSAEGKDNWPEVSKGQAVEFSVPTKTLKDLRAMAQSKTLDFIKLDVEGEEKYLLEDAESKGVLCDAMCVFMELHERFVPGCDANFAAFMKEGCPDGSKFKRVTTTGEYILVCKEDLVPR